MPAPTYVHLPAGREPPPLPNAGPFKAVIIIEATVAPEWRVLVSEWLVQAGCLYAMAWGDDCSAWDDSIDYANLDAFDLGDIPDDAFVMTTWHEDEPLSEVFWFAAHTATHLTIELTRTLILDISPTARAADMIRAFQAARANLSGDYPHPVIPDGAQRRSGTQEVQAPRPVLLGPGSPLRCGRDDSVGVGSRRWLAPRAHPAIHLTAALQPRNGPSSPVLESTHVR